jgi:hypothetical protein
MQPEGGVVQRYSGAVAQWYCELIVISTTGTLHSLERNQNYLKSVKKYGANCGHRTECTSRMEPLSDRGGNSWISVTETCMRKFTEALYLTRRNISATQKNMRNSPEPIFFAQPRIAPAQCFSGIRG